VQLAGTDAQERPFHSPDVTIGVRSRVEKAVDFGRSTLRETAIVRSSPPKFIISSIVRYVSRGDQEMKVFVAGANGAIGRPLVKALVAAKHEVFGMTTSTSGIEALRNQGAEGVVLDALDAKGVSGEIARIRPDAIIDELTSLPKRYTPEEMRAVAPRDRQVRLEGGGNLHSAAVNYGVKRYVVQSTGFFYGLGKGLASESDDLAHKASPGVAGSVATYTKIEDRLFSNPGLEGVALRYGFSTGQVLTTTHRTAASRSRSVNVNIRSSNRAPAFSPSFTSRMPPLRPLHPWRYPPAYTTSSIATRVRWRSGCRLLPGL
jgi:hypothetical protein